ncbi:MAG: hypothetical protein ACQGVK_12880 [Myxococcota bacterium]
MIRASAHVDRDLAQARGPGKSPGAPAWARALVAGAPTLDPTPPLPGAALRARARDRVALASFEVPAADTLGEEAFREAVDLGYRALAAELSARSLRPLRYWNYVPSIGDAGPSGLSGYELFNQARRTTFERPSVAPLGQGSGIAASAVDTRGGDLSIFVLAADRLPEPIDNPRQIEPHEYSARYGPVAPRFARAVAIDEALVRDLGFPDAIVSGTASIVGEATRHVGDLEAQLCEAAVNLATVSLAFSGRAESRPVGADLDPVLREALGAYGDLRIYVPRPGDEAAIAEWAGELFPGAHSLEFVGADLCRPDLLVEVEGTLQRTR